MGLEESLRRLDGPLGSRGNFFSVNYRVRERLFSILFGWRLAVGADSEGWWREGWWGL